MVSVGENINLQEASRLHIRLGDVSLSYFLWKKSASYMLLNMVHLTIIFLEHFSTWFGSKYDYGSDFAIL